MELFLVDVGLTEVDVRDCYLVVCPWRASLHDVRRLSGEQGSALASKQFMFLRFFRGRAVPVGSRQEMQVLVCAFVTQSDDDVRHLHGKVPVNFFVRTK